MTNHNHHHDHTCEISPVSTLHQSLDELEFERGIWSAAQSGDINRIKKLVQKGEDPNRQDNSGYTALHYAARSGHHEICIYLLDSGADINAVTRAGQVTALQRASTAGKIEIVKLLLSRRAKIKIQDNDGKTALHRAAESKHEKIYELLLQQDNELLNIRDNKSKLASDYGP